MRERDRGQKDPYNFDDSDDNIIESYSNVKKYSLNELCRQLVLEIAFKAVDQGREDKLDSIFNSVLADKSSSSDTLKDNEKANKLKRIFDEVVGVKKNEQRKGKKSLDDILMDVMPKVKIIKSENRDQAVCIKSRACSENCPNQHCFEIPEPKVDNIRSKLRAMRVSELHNFLLQRLNSQQELG